MRLMPIVLALVMFAPVVLAEGMHIQAVGGTMGQRTGATGYQWDNEGAVGVRYWINSTGPGGVLIIVTTCATPDSHAIVFCERQRVTA